MILHNSSSTFNRMLSLAKAVERKKGANSLLSSYLSNSKSNNLSHYRSFCKTRLVSKEGPVDYGYKVTDDRFENHQPTIEYAKAMPKSFSAMRHEQIIQLCVEGSGSAREEALIRNIMAVDTIEHDEAIKVLEKIKEENRKGMNLSYLPYHIGIGTSMVAGAVSFPLVFHHDTVVKFNDAFVTAEAPSPEDFETILECGSFAWGWMEPIMGQISFVLLVFQFARSQALNLGIRPYANWVKNRRANRILALFPQYDEVFVRWYSESQSVYGKS
jgi:hypothetical protein